MPKPKSWAQETLGFPAPGRMLDAPDITGSVPKKEDKPAVAAPEAVPPPPDNVVYPDPNRPITSSERAVLESLQARRQEIEARAREIDIRESLMKSAEKRIEGKIEEMKATEARVSVSGQQKNEQDAARFKGLVTMYEAMKPKDAAKVFDRLELSVLFEIDRFVARVLPDSAANTDLPPFFAAHVTTPHSVVTAHLIDEAGQPTMAARDEIMSFFKRRLAQAG